MEYLFWIGISVLWGLWCLSIAKKHGFNEVVAFVVGFIVGLLGVIGYAIAGKMKKDKIRNARIERLLMEKEAKKEADKN